MNDFFEFDDFFSRPFSFTTRRINRPPQQGRPQHIFDGFFQNHPFFRSTMPLFTEPQLQPEPTPRPRPRSRSRPVFSPSPRPQVIEDSEVDDEVEYIGSSIPAQPGRANTSSHWVRPEPVIEEPRESAIEEEQTRQQLQRYAQREQERKREQERRKREQERFQQQQIDQFIQQRRQQSRDELDEKHTDANEPKPMDRQGAAPTPTAPSAPEPTFNLKQDNEKFVATYVLPGYPPNQVKMEAQLPGEEDEEVGALLCITAERKTDDGGVVPFSSILEIPLGVSPNSISAYYNDATETLTVTIPKPKASVAAIDIQRS